MAEALCSGETPFQQRHYRSISCVMNVIRSFDVTVAKVDLARPTHTCQCSAAIYCAFEYVCHLLSTTTTAQRHRKSLCNHVQVCTAHIHAFGNSHRDIKPENVHCAIDNLAAIKRIDFGKPFCLVPTYHRMDGEDAIYTFTRLYPSDEAKNRGTKKGREASCLLPTRSDNRCRSWPPPSQLGHAVTTSEVNATFAWSLRLSLRTSQLS